MSFLARTEADAVSVPVPESEEIPVWVFVQLAATPFDAMSFKTLFMSAQFIVFLAFLSIFVTIEESSITSSS